MVQAIPLIVGSAVSAAAATTAIGATVLFGKATVATVLGAVTSAVVGSAMARREEKKMLAASRAQAAANLRDVRSVMRSAVEPRAIIYGRALAGGTIPFWFVTGDVGQIHHWAQTIAGHEIDAVEAYRIGDDPVEVDGGGWVTTPKYCRADGTRLIRVRAYRGDQTALDAELVTASAGALSAADAGRGIAYLYVRWEADYDVFGQTGAPLVRCIVRGKRLFDPRTGLTAWSENTALAVRDYLTSHQGLRCTPAEINDADVIAAANVCDELVAIAAGATQRRYTVNGVLSCETPLRANLETLTDAMAGVSAWVQGRWSVQAGAWQVPTMTIGPDDVISVEELIAFTPRRDLFNTVSGLYVEPGDGWVEKQYPAVTNATYVSQDGGHVISRDIQQPLCTDAIRAQRMAKIEIERARQAVTVAMTCKWTTYDLRPGSHVTVTIPRYGWAAKVFFVADRSLSEDGIRYILRETAPGVWQWNFGEATAVDLAPNTNLPNPNFVPALTGLSATSGTGALQIAGDGTVISRIRVQWGPIADVYVRTSGRVEVRYRPLGASAWESASTSGQDASLFVGPVHDRIAYEIEARAINAIGQRGPWASITHTVIGKTEPPPNVTGLTVSGSTVSWQPITGVVDLAGYVVRFQYGNHPWWESAAPLHDGLVLSVPWEMPRHPAGPVTIMVKAVDTSGNESVTAAFAITNFGDARVENVLATWPQQPLWQGTVVGGTVLAGVLQTAQTDHRYGSPAEPFYGAAAAAFYAPATFGDMVYEFAVTPFDGGRFVLRHTIEAQAFQILYRRGNQVARYGMGGDPFYGPGHLPIFGAPGQWETWPGEIEIAAPELLEWRVQVAGGAQIGRITMLDLVTDVPDINEGVPNAVIASSGSRLPITRTYRQIVAVQATLRDDGNGGRSVIVRDKDRTGPMIEVRNGAGALVAGLVDVHVQGF